MKVRAGTLFLVLATSPAAAQGPSGRIHDPNLHAWFVYAGDHPVSERWGVHVEGQWRRHDAGIRPQQTFGRPAVNFKVTDRFSVTGGYAFALTHRYGDFPARAAFPEHRIYQQAIYQYAYRGINLQHRARVEQRWIGVRAPLEGGGVADLGWRRQNRFRYFFRIGVPWKKTPWSFIASNELLLNFASPGTPTFDQNRAFGGLGYNVGRFTRVEAGYLQQSLLQRNGRILELNHTMLVSINSRFPFRKAKAR